MPCKIQSVVVVASFVVWVMMAAVVVTAVAVAVALVWAAAIVNMVVEVLVTGVIIVVVDGIGVVFADVNMNVLAAVMTVLDFAVSAPLEESILFCRAAFSCWLMAVLDCANVLQT